MEDRRTAGSVTGGGHPVALGLERNIECVVGVRIAVGGQIRRDAMMRRRGSIDDGVPRGVRVRISVQEENVWPAPTFEDGRFDSERRHFSHSARPHRSIASAT